MARKNAAALGKEPVGKLLIDQAVPASIGILVMSLNILVDTIFVGNWIGSIAIAAINVVLPVSFFIAALGMAIGIGGSSIISRALGSEEKERAYKTFGNQIILTLLLTIVMVVLGLIYVDSLIPAFGGKGDIFDPAKIYYTVVLYGIPFLALCMMGNTVIRAEGKPKFCDGGNDHSFCGKPVSGLYTYLCFRYGNAWCRLGFHSFLSFLLCLYSVVLSLQKF